MSDTKTRDRPAASYEGDLSRWIAEQVAALRESRWADLDWENLAEEVESVGRNDRRELISRLEVLLAHLLKCMFQPARRTRSWDQSIREQRDEIAKLIARSPSLRPLLRKSFDSAYSHAVSIAERDTGLAETHFPPKAPFTLQRALSPQYWPDGEDAA
jgi:hypothetical protein